MLFIQYYSADPKATRKGARTDRALRYNKDKKESQAQATTGINYRFPSSKTYYRNNNLLRQNMHYQVPVSECRLLSPAVFNLFIKQRFAIYIQQQETKATSEKKLNGMNGEQQNENEDEFKR
ncbi:hypothetical protein QE152_g3524 [Popillia japonica]|uniref:Uncharacterized protein n=1 Tax=Popillia japonica TaxID=7064 RepID=A0AAW1N652_POPJA